MIEIGKPFELLEPTHRGLHRFVPRHPDEIEIDIGDPVYVQREAEDLWCEGNLQLSWSKIQRIIILSIQINLQFKFQLIHSLGRP